MLFEDALLGAISASYADAAIRCSGHAIRCPDWFVMRFSERRFHHKMEASVGSDKECEIVRFAAIVKAGDIEDPLCVFEEYIHAGLIDRHPRF